MRIIYSDETGVGDAKTEPNTVVAAVIIHGDFQLPALQLDVAEIKEKYLPAMSPLERDLYEFKANKLFGQISRPGRKDMLLAFLGLLTKYNLPVCAIAVDRLGYNTEKSEIRNELPDLFKGKLDKILSAQDAAFMLCAFIVESFFQAHAPWERGVWIADETTLSLNIRKNFRVLTLLPLGRLPQTQIRSIADTVYFGNSRDSVGLQLADACNFFLGAHLDHKRSTAVTEFADIVKQQLVFPLNVMYPSVSTEGS